MAGRYFELHCKSNFSFLEGASHAQELADRAKELGYGGLAITDRETFAGVVRGHTAAADLGLGFVVGAELHPVDGPAVVAWAATRQGYGRLCRLLTVGRRRAQKGRSLLYWRDLVAHRGGWCAALRLQLPDAMTSAFQANGGPDWFVANAGDEDLEEEGMELPPARSITPSSAIDRGVEIDDLLSSPSAEIPLPPLPSPDRCPDPASWHGWVTRFREWFEEDGYLALSLHRGVDDREKIEGYRSLKKSTGVPWVACGQVLYHCPQRMVLQDCLTAIAHGTTIDRIATLRPKSSQFAMRPIAELWEVYRGAEDALDQTVEVAERCRFSLSELKYEYPIECAQSGVSAIETLKRLTWEGARSRYPAGVPQRIVGLLEHEFRLIEELRYEPYFLTVWDLVRFARSRGILCQGRGSAANSVVCFCLGITSVDPLQMDVLFERFVSKERNEAPDIDVDFEHERREEVLQYLYEKYGRHRAGLTAAVITYRTRSALRDCGKAMGLSNDRLDVLSKIADGRRDPKPLEDRCRDAGIDPMSPQGKRFVYLVKTLIGFPRHLSQHVGGMVMTQGVLHELCPVENAAMDSRTVIQWDKDDLDALGILKVDCLALGMLSAIRRSFDLLQLHQQTKWSLATIPKEDPQVYDMVCQADTIGVFQIESRAQMSMLPRLKPRCYYDLVIEVAIMRPGPIQGQMVHPYLKARQTGQQPHYPTKEIGEVLSRTMGVPIFQEQAMRLAVVAAGFTPGEADQLRRAMAAWRRPGVIDQFRQKLVDGMLARGLSRAFADQVFTQIRGFGEYGFPESHAASFAHLVYASAWLKRHHPAVFCAALLNSQPMGFYGPSQLVQDAKRHGVEILPAEINASDWDCTLEPSKGTVKPLPHLESVSPRSRWAVRLGLRMVKGLQRQLVDRWVDERKQAGSFRDLGSLRRRTGMTQAEMTRLADAGVLQSLVEDRRAALWESLAQKTDRRATPLLDLVDDPADPIPQAIAPTSAWEEVAQDYQATGLSLQGHPLEFSRPRLKRGGVLAAGQLQETEHGKPIRVAGIVLVRQQPGTAKGIVFVTLEDETGTVNLVFRQEVWQRYALVCKQSNAWLVEGILESREGVRHLLVRHVEDLSTALQGISIGSRDFR
jgi:error-prone DNA polymerase